METLDANILKTLIYFNIFERPLTLLEVKKWLINDKENISLSALEQALNRLPIIKQKKGLYYLSGSERIIQTKLERYNIAEKKFKKRRWILRALCWLPHIKMLAICNSLSWSNARPDSDIDVFIITKKKRIWTSRFFATGLVSLLRLRPQSDFTKNTICLSFFTAEDNLNFEKIQCLPNDLHFQIWLTQFLPLYDENGYFDKFVAANSAWLRKTLPNWYPQDTASVRRIELTGLEKILKKILAIFSWENFYRKIQLKILASDLKKLANKDTRVIINNQMLKMHPLDRRDYYFKLWKEKCAEYKVDIN